MGSATFDWIPAYEAIATSLLGYEDRQSELCDIVYDVIGERYKAMDPFTFFSMFNGKRRNVSKRAEAISKIVDSMGIDVEVPSGFEGVPLTNAQKWRFWDGGSRTIENNWGAFKAAVAFADSPDPTPDLISEKTWEWWSRRPLRARDISRCSTT